MSGVLAREGGESEARLHNLGELMTIPGAWSTAFLEVLDELTDLFSPPSPKCMPFRKDLIPDNSQSHRERGTQQQMLVSNVMKPFSMVAA
jgi:hypothetical protein